jgi:hypothetical protein
MEPEKLDYKKKDKDLYLPGTKPSVIKVPAMNFIMVDGKGNPNTDGGEYQQAVELLYALSYSIKMGYKNGSTPEGYSDYVVPPLEGLWWLDGGTSADSDFTQKEKYFWTSMIRQPEFVTQEVFERACREAAKKKPGLDTSKARLETFEEGQCVQVMHLGPYDEEPKTIAELDAFILANHYQNAIGDTRPDGIVRRHHEIYLGDPRKTEPSKRKTVLRHPVKK